MIIQFQEKRLAQEISALEKDTGYKLRVLAQNYPDTPGLWSPSWHTLRAHSRLWLMKWKLEAEIMYCYYAGLAVKNFWQVDDSTVVFVADPTFGKASMWLLAYIWFCI